MTNPWAFGWDQIAAFANTAAIVFAAWIAKRSVREWRQERLEARQSEVAEQALSLAYQASEVFDRIRSPLSFPDEGSSRRPQAGEKPEDKEARDQDFIPFERITNETRFFEQVIDIRPRIDALFGKGSSESFNKFLEVRWEIIHAARMLNRIRRQTRFQTPEDEQRYSQKIEQYDKIVWSRPKEDDIRKQLEDAVASIECVAEPVLKSHFRRR